MPTKKTFSLMGAFQTQARKEGWTPDEIKTVIDDCMSGDYDHLLRVLLRGVRVTSIEICIRRTRKISLRPCSKCFYTEAYLRPTRKGALTARCVACGAYISLRITN